jgi:EmrB/QacA subfamily drug resistance transporter
LLAAAVFLVPFGRLADIHGRRRVYLLGTGVFTLATLVIGVSSSGAMLIAARALQGLGSAMIFGTGVAILTSVFDPSERGRVLGINVAAVYMGLSLGPTVGGVLTQNLGWRSIFYLTVLVGLAAMYFVAFRLRGEWAEARGESFDLIGSVIYSLALVTLMYGLTLLPEFEGMVLIAVGLVSFAGFVVLEHRVAHPVLELSLFAQNRVFAFSSLAALINYAATSAVTFLLSLYLQYIRELTPQQTGMVLIAAPIMQALFSPLAGRLSDRVEPRLVASSGMALTAISLCAFILVDAVTPLWVVVFQLVILGLGFALFSSPNMNAIMGSVQRRYYGVASGTLGTMRLVGQMLSMGITTLLFALYIGRVEITPPTYPMFMKSVQTAFLIFFVLCLGGIFASLARGRLRASHDT